MTRLIRGQVLSLREREFIQAAQVMGVPTRRILFKELLPNLVAPIVVATSLALPGPDHGRGRPVVPRHRRHRHPVARADDRRRAALLGRLPAVPVGAGRSRSRVLVVVAQPPRRLGPRRLRPQDSPVTRFTGRNATSTERVGYAVQITVDCRLCCRDVGSERLWRLWVISGTAGCGHRSEQATSATPATARTPTPRGRSRSPAPRRAAPSRC